MLTYMFLETETTYFLTKIDFHIVLQSDKVTNMKCIILNILIALDAKLKSLWKIISSSYFFLQNIFMTHRFFS